MRWSTKVSLTGFRPVGGDVFIQFHLFKFLKILQFYLENVIWEVKNLSSPPRNNRSQLCFDFQSKIELLFNTGPLGIRVFGLAPPDTVTDSHFSPIFSLKNVLKGELSLRISIVQLHMGSCESCSHSSVQDMELQLGAEPTLSSSVVFSLGNENKSYGKLMPTELT